MNYYEKLLYIRQIRDRLMDEESKVIFDAKIDYMITRDDDAFVKAIWPFLKEMYCEDLISYSMGRAIVIFGSGHDGIRTKNVLELCGYHVECFCDNDKNKIGKTIEGLQVISLDKLVKDHYDCLVVLGSRVYLEEMHKQLVRMKFPLENIISPRLRIVAGGRKGQYFDVFESEESEVFVDAGSYNGDTTKEFMVWANGGYKKIFVIEPLKEQFKYIENRSKSEKWDNIVLCNKAAWECNEELNFFENDTGSLIVKGNTGTVINGESIDNIVGDENVTFIKMDIEGAELKALEGAKKTIKLNKPKLAISIYHKYEDIIDLPLKILSIVPEYNFYLRHYSTDRWETVLYAKV